jgi:hypothetical protein
MPKWAYESHHNQLCQRVDEPNRSRYGRNGFTFQHFAREEYGLNLVSKYEVPPNLPERLGKTVSIQLLELSFQIVIGLSVSPARNASSLARADLRIFMESQAAQLTTLTPRDEHKVRTGS